MGNSGAYVLDFDSISMNDVPRVGGKNASLGEMYNALAGTGVRALDGFATTTAAYHRLLEEGALGSRLEELLAGLDTGNIADLAARGAAARAMVAETPLPDDVAAAILLAYGRLRDRLGRDAELAVRSSATAEDLPGASFAGQHATVLNVRGEQGLLAAVSECYASLFTDRAIDYRARHGYNQMSVALSVGVQPMVRANEGSAGVIFTLDPESGVRDLVVVSGTWGLGEPVVRGSVSPDEWSVFKPTLATAPMPIIARRLGTKEVRAAYAEDGGTVEQPTSAADRARYSLADDDVLALARWAVRIEEHYSRLAGHPQPMDIEWAKDGVTGELAIVQARPETVHSARPASAVAVTYHLDVPGGEVLARGQAVGEKIAAGPVRIVREARDLARVQPGDILVARITDPDWEPVMKRVAAIVTNEGGRTAHAAIVSRELGLPCIVGTGNATESLVEGAMVTVCCAEGNEGHVYAGEIPFHVESVGVGELAPTRTAVMLNVGDPAKAFAHAALPNAGVGLARLEFIVNNQIGMHPMALVRYPALASPEAVAAIAERIGTEQPAEYFVRRLAEGVARIAAAFFPRPVIVRTSDFKTNEYARLLGGAEFEPSEENPMLGFRGASRYYDERYAEGFALECAALLRVREQMGLVNVKVMIPFCRTVAEAERVIATMAGHGLRQGHNGLEIYAMCELPSNVMNADAFLRVFDGYSIGSNDLTQLVLGIDRDSGTVAHLFDERDPAVMAMIAQAIAAAHRAGKPIGICGQAPSDYPEFAAWLVEQGITSISLNPDAVVRMHRIVSEAESRGAGASATMP